MLTKRDVLNGTNFGQPVAEQERKFLRSYFVETDQWHRMFNGEIDIVFGAKGSGKSAIYALLLDRENDLFDRGTLVVAAENPQGSLAFDDLVHDPPTDENQFRELWKLYFLILLGTTLRKCGISVARAGRVLSALEEADLLPEEFSLSGLLRAAREYVRKKFNPESIEAGLKVDPASGHPAIVGKITFREPTPEGHRLGLVSVDALLKLANDAFAEADFTVWLLLDRLDVVFAQHPELERNALRGLFRAYSDMSAYDNIALKIFRRTDLWNRVNEGGFSEASHVVKTVTISWDGAALLNLIVRRALSSAKILEFYNVDPNTILTDAEEQKQFFYRMFPKQIDVGKKKPSSLDWILFRVADGTGKPAPRELIQLLSSAREIQLRKLEIGTKESDDEALFEGSAIKEALPAVSHIRFEQTLCAEFPKLKDWLMALRGQKTQQSLETLASIWGVDRPAAMKIANQLVEVGFFEKTGPNDAPEYWVPFIYRSALDMVQGTAEMEED